MGFFAKIKKYLGFTKLSELSIIVNKKLKEGNISRWLNLSNKNKKECLKLMCAEILRELPSKKYTSFETKSRMIKSEDEV